MGSSQTKSGGIIMDFDRSYYFAGNQVNGNIYVNMDDSFKTTGLEISIEGVESTNFMDKTMKEKHIYHDLHNFHGLRMTTQTKEGKYILFKKSIQISDFFKFNTVDRGQYTFPLSFIIPFNLPGSFEYYDKESSAYIRYSINARLISLSGPENDISSSYLLIVRQSPQFFSYPHSLYDYKEIKTLCLFNRGSSILTVSYPKNYFSPDESVPIICNVNNSNCDVSAKKIKIEIFQKITLRDNYANTKFMTRKVTERVFEGKFPAKRETTRTLEVPITDYDNPSLKYFSGGEIFPKLTDQISKLQASVKSYLIECSYYLRASLLFGKFGFVKSVPTIDIPILIYIPEISRQNISSYKPENWSPQVMPTTAINIPSAEELGIPQPITQPQLQ